MDILRIEHEDFTLTVESSQFQRMWDKGASVLGSEKLVSSYHWSEGVERVVLVHDNAEREVVKDTTDEAVFFEQTDYSVWVDFKKKATKAWIDSPRKDVGDWFSWKVGVVKADNPQYANFLNGTASIYYSGDTFPTTIPLDGMDYFAPYIPDKGIRDLYLVTGIHTAKKAKGADDDKLRITFNLEFARQLFADYRIVQLPIQHTFDDTKLDKLTSERPTQ